MRIRGAMLDALRKVDWVPRSLRSKASKLSKANEQARIKFGHSPTDEQLALFMQIDLCELKKLQTKARAIALEELDRPKFETDSDKGSGSIRESYFSKTEGAPDDRLRSLQFLRKITAGLSRNERLLMICRYYENMTMKEIGESLDVSESRISQMHSSIVRKLGARYKREELLC